MSGELEQRQVAAGEGHGEGTPSPQGVVSEVYIQRVDRTFHVDGAKDGLTFHMEQRAYGVNKSEPEQLIIRVDLKTVKGWKLDTHKYILTLTPIQE